MSLEKCLELPACVSQLTAGGTSVHPAGDERGDIRWVHVCQVDRLNVVHYVIDMSEWIDDPFDVSEFA